MPTDEQAIRDLISAWQQASAAGDLPQLLSMMAEDVVFLVPAHPPMRGRSAFAAAFQSIAGRYHLESSAEIQEIRIAGEWAYCWNHLTVTITPVGPGTPTRRAGHTLSIFRKQANGAWVLARDANLLTSEPV